MPPCIVIYKEKGGYIGKTLEAGNSEERSYNTKNIMNRKKVIKSLRLCRYLYSLGFDKESIVDNGNEYWKFEKSSDLDEALDFYFYMRKKQEKKL